MRTLKVMVVDNEPRIRRVWRAGLVAQGFEVDEASTGTHAIEKLRETMPDVVLLVLNIPGIDGLDACREIRSSSEVPIIVVSVDDTRLARTAAFEAGADQFVAKPCGIQKLIAPIRAVTQGVDFLCSRVLDLGRVEINLDTHEIRRGNSVGLLTSKQFELLHCLARHAGRTVPHRRILQAVWGPEYGLEIGYLRVFINQLRKKVEPNPKNPIYIVTEPSMGYRLAVPPKPVLESTPKYPHP